MSAGLAGDFSSSQSVYLLSVCPHDLSLSELGREEKKGEEGNREERKRRRLERKGRLEGKRRCRKENTLVFLLIQ